MPGFSDHTKLLIQRWNLLEAAETLLWEEWRRLLEETAILLRRSSWLTRVYSSPADRKGHLRAHRPSWPDRSDLRIHLQAGIDADRLRRGLAYLELHVEGDAPERALVVTTLQRLLEPYQASGALLRECDCTLPRRSKRRLLRATRTLPEATAQSLADGLERLGRMAPFVDEAVFLADKQPLWRTDFLPGDPEPQLRYRDSEGGQTIALEPGRLGTPCLQVNGQQRNYQGDLGVGNLALLTDLRGVSAGEQVYLSCNLLVHEPVCIFLYGEVRGYDFPPAFVEASPSAQLASSDEWQHVGLSARVVEEEGYSFQDEGLNVYLITRTDDAGLLIDGIEIGRMGESG